MFGVGTQKKDDVIAMDARESRLLWLFSLLLRAVERIRESEKVDSFFLSFLFIWMLCFLFLFSLRVFASFRFCVWWVGLTMDCNRRVLLTCLLHISDSLHCKYYVFQVDVFDRY